MNDFLLEIEYAELRGRIAPLLLCQRRARLLLKRLVKDVIELLLVVVKDRAAKNSVNVVASLLLNDTSSLDDLAVFIINRLDFELTEFFL